MRLHVLPWALGAAWALGACTGPSTAASGQTLKTADAPARVSTGQPPRNRCDAQPLQAWLGQPYTPNTLARALAAAGADEARMLRPDTPITKEYQTGRLNLVVGTDNRISRVYCG